MQLAVPVPSLNPSKMSLDQALNIYALEKALSSHDLLKVPMDELPSEQSLRLLERQDGIIITHQPDSQQCSESWLTQLNSKMHLPLFVVPEHFALLINEIPFHSEGPRLIFCPAIPDDTPIHQSTILRAWMKTLYCKLTEIFPTAWLIGSAQDIALGAVPGTRTVLCPGFPNITAKAIASSRGVLSFNIQPALLALAHHVPSFLVCTDESAARTARQNSIPFMMWNMEHSPEKVAEAFQSVIKNYPWNSVEPAIAKQRDELSTLCKKHGLLTNSHAVRKVSRKKSKTLRFSCIADEKYLPFFTGLVENLLDVHGPDMEIHLLGIGNKTGDAASALFPKLDIHTIRLEEIWSKEELTRIFRYPIGLRAVASKPRLLQYLVKETRRTPCSFLISTSIFSDPQSIFLPSSTRSRCFCCHSGAIDLPGRDFTVCSTPGLFLRTPAPSQSWIGGQSNASMTFHMTFRPDITWIRLVWNLQFCISKASRYTGHWMKMWLPGTVKH